MIKPIAMKKTLLLLTGFISVLFASADNSTVRYGNKIVITQPVYGDLYIAGGSVTINAPVYGELVVAGGNVFINDTITGDINMLAGKAILRGYAGDDLRCLAGTVEIRGNIAGDLAAIGGEILLNEAASAGGLIGAGGTVNIRGNIHGNVLGSFEKFILHGNVSGTFDCRSKDLYIDGRIEGDTHIASPEISISTQSYFARNLYYRNRSEKLILDPHSVKGIVQLDPNVRLDEYQWYYLGGATLLGFLWYIGVIISFLLVFQWLMGKLLHSSAIKAAERPLISIVYGLLFIVITPVAAVIIMCSVIGIPMGLMVLALYGIVLLSVLLLVSLLCANIWLIRYNRQWGYWKICFVALGVFIILKLIISAGFIGWAVMTILVLWALGAITDAAINYYRKLA